MKLCALELDDRAMSLAREGQVLSSAPSAVFNEGGAEAAVGGDAWKSLRLSPVATSTRHLSSVLTSREVSPNAATLVAQELRARLAEHPVAASEHLWIAAPACADANGLGSILAVIRGIGVCVEGFVDSASVTVAALGLERNAVVLELGLHHVAATAVDSDSGHARRRRSVLIQRAGLMELQQAWLDLISTTMVKRTRFDPLHDAATEQRLFDGLPALLRDAATNGVATVVVTKGTERFEIAVTRDQFAQAAQRVYRAIFGLLHQLRPAGMPVAIVVPGPVAGLPGLREEFEQFTGCELVTVPEGFAAAVTSLLDLPDHVPGADTVRLLRRVPLQTRAMPLGSVSRDSLGKRRSDGPPPSHVLFDGRAYSLGVELFVVGRDPELPSSIVLPDGLAGVSRRHCTFIHDGGDVVLLDHSTFGTFVNGERVAERVRVHAGDRVRLGEPGVELALIAVGATAVAAQP